MDDLNTALQASVDLAAASKARGEAPALNRQHDLAKALAHQQRVIETARKYADEPTERDEQAEIRAALDDLRAGRLTEDEIASYVDDGTFVPGVDVGDERGQVLGGECPNGFVLRR